MKRIEELDGLRAIAPLMVIAWHYIGIPDGPGFWLWNVFYLGHFGVDLFFVLSGFLITTILLENRASDTFFSSFYGRRVFRIWPIYYLMCALSLIGWLSGASPTLFQGVVPGWTYIFGIQNFWMAKLQNYGAFLQDVANGTLPAVAFVRPCEALAGHPADSTSDLYEQFLPKLIAANTAKKLH